MPIDTHKSDYLLNGSPDTLEDSLVREHFNAYRILELLWEKRRLLMFWVLAGVALAIVLRLVLPPRFESTTRLLPSQNTSNISMMMMAGGAGGAGAGASPGLPPHPPRTTPQQTQAAPRHRVPRRPPASPCSPWPRRR